MTQNDVMQLIIAKDLGAVTPTTATGSQIVAPNSATYLADGEYTVVNSHNVVLGIDTILTDDIVASSGIKIIGRNGTSVVVSDMIKQHNIVSAKAIADAAAVQQVSYIGYNGTSGSITATNSKLYVVRLRLKETDNTGQGQDLVLNAPYKSDASATQTEVAVGIAQALSNVTRRQSVQPIKAEIVSSHAHYATGTMANTVVITKGSKIVSATSNTNYNTNIALAVGDFVRLANSTGAPAVTDPVYKVVSLDSATQFTLDRPVESASATWKSTSLNMTVITAAKIAASNLGIKLTGIARTFSLPNFKDSIVSFLIGLDSSISFGDTLVTYTTAASRGVGTYNQIAELEWNLAGNKGNPYRGDALYTAPTLVASSSKTYNQISITYYADPITGGVGGTPRRMKQLIIALEAGFSAGEPPDHLVKLLTAFTTVDLSTASS